MIGYKLTNQDMQTHNNTQWQLGEWKETNGEGDLCSPGWLHYYSDPFLAVLLNPIHANFQLPRLFKAEVEGITKENDGLKFGCTRMRLVKELQLPAISAEQRVKFAIYCALEVTANPAFVTWANSWLNGTDRSAEFNYWAVWITKTAAWAVANIYTAKAAYMAAYWANQNAWISNIWTARTAAEAARFWGLIKAKPIDLIALAKKAMQ